MTQDIDAAVALIKEFEGLELEPYRDPVGLWTIGYGHLIRGDETFTRITEGEAEALLRKDLKEAMDVVNGVVKSPLNWHQKAALYSFVFNLGGKKFKNSTLLKLLNKGEYKLAEGEFKRWIYAGGKELAGLVRRRIAERDMFNGLITKR